MGMAGACCRQLGAGIDIPLFSSLFFSLSLYIRLVGNQVYSNRVVHFLLSKMLMPTHSELSFFWVASEDLDVLRYSNADPSATN